MAEQLKPVICVIGAGPAGVTVALAAAVLGVSTVLIESRAMGGPRIARGSLPAHVLRAAARQAAAAGSAEAAAAIAAGIGGRIQEAIASAAPDVTAERLRGLGVRVIEGTARFKDRRTVIVGDGEGAIEIVARHVVIATGATPAVPPIPGLDTGPYLTTDMIGGLTNIPARLIVIGAEADALMLAQSFRRLGSDVTVLAPQVPLRDEDPEAGAIVLDQFARDGIALRAPVTIERVAHAAGEVSVTIAAEGSEEVITGTALLVADGRKPGTDALDLAAAGIAYDAAGIAVDQSLRTSNTRVYAIGGVAALPMRSTQAAEHEAALVVRHALLRQRVRHSPENVPHAVFTEPALAHVGIGEAQARAAGMQLRVLRWPYYDNDRARAERLPHGHIKVIVTPKGKILSATCVGAEAAELIAPWTLAVAQGLSIGAMAEAVAIYPTYSEVGKRAALTSFALRLTRGWAGRIMALLRIFG